MNLHMALGHELSLVESTSTSLNGIAAHSRRGIARRGSHPYDAARAPTAWQERHQGMRITVASGDIARVETQCVVVNLFEGVGAPAGGTGSVDRALDGMITELIAAGDI